MKQTTRKDRAGKRFSSERSVLRRFMAEALFRKDSIFRCKILSLLYEAICFYPCIHHFCSLRRSGAGERRHDRHGVLLPAAAGAARGRAGQPDLRGGAARRAGSRCLRAGASGRPAPRRRVCRRGDLLARARIPRHGRCRGAGRKFGRRPDRAKITRSLPTFSRNSAVMVSTRLSMLQLGSRPQISNRKLLSSC